MPRYIGYTPQFNPVSLQEYLAVPTMIQQEFDTYEDKYNENLDKLAVLEGMLDDSTRDYLNAYKNNLSNAADIISGKTGNLSTLRQQTNAARQFYREYAPRLTNAYNKRQAALKAQQDILLKDPSAVTTQVGNMQSFLDNPDQVFHSLSGDKIYADMINAGKLSAADLSRVENANLPGYLAKVTGYTPQQQQEYAMLVQQALSGNKDADAALKNNPIYTQPYQVLNKYIEDNKFNLFNDSEKAYALNRALSGQLMGMTSHTDYMADKQWEHNSRMAAAKASTGNGPTLPTNNPEYPTALRPASFGRKDLKGNEGNFAIVNSDGSISAKKGDELLDAFGVPKTEKTYSFTDSAGVKHYTNRKLSQEERINRLFASDGRIRKEYSKYTQLSDFGLDLEQSFNSPDVDRVVTEGSITRPTQRIETIKGNTNKERFKNLQNALENTYKTSPEGISNSYYAVIPTNFDPEDIKDVIGKTQYNDWEVFQGQTVDKEGNLNPIRGKKISKRDVISSFNAAQAAGNNPTMDFIHGSNFAVIDLHDGENVFMTTIDRLDPNFSHKYTYTHKDLKKRDEEIEEAKESLEKAEYNYSKNPTNTNRLKHLKAKRIYDSLVWEKEHIGDVYMQGFTKSRVDKTSSRNVNTKEESEKRQEIFNAVTQ